MRLFLELIRGRNAVLLVSLAARPTPGHLLEEPQGHYDHHRQKWVWTDEDGTERLDWVMSSGHTGDPTTFSSTTNAGKDNDVDDKGS